MGYKTVSICRRTDEIVNVLRHNFGYSITNLRKILVDEFGYKSGRDIQNKIRISGHTLYTPLAYQDQYGYSLLIKLVGELLEKYNNGELRNVDCWTLRYYSKFSIKGFRPLTISRFRAENIYEERIKILLKQEKYINYESPYYLP